MAGKNELKAVKNPPAKLETFKITKEEALRIKCIDKSQQLLNSTAQAAQNEINRQESELAAEKAEFKELIEGRVDGVNVEDYSFDYKTGTASLRKEQPQNMPGLPPGAANAKPETQENAG